jgi:transcriptional regulator NrdR family protein
MTARCRHTRSRVGGTTREEGHRNAVNRPFRYHVYRRRTCKDCGAVFRTFELTEEEILALLRNVDAIAAKLGRPA